MKRNRKRLLFHSGILLVSLVIALLLINIKPQEIKPSNIYIRTEVPVSCTAKIYEDGLFKSERKILPFDKTKPAELFISNLELQGDYDYYYLLQNTNITSEDYEIRIVCYEPGYTGITYLIINSSNIKKYFIADWVLE